MNCNECNKCTYKDNMVNLCLDKDTRELLLDLIYVVVNREINNYEFLYKDKCSEDLKDFLPESIRGNFDCMLPNKDEKVSDKIIENIKCVRNNQ